MRVRPDIGAHQSTWHRNRQVLDSRAMRWLLAIIVVCPAVFGGCKKKQEKEAPTLVLTEEKDPVEERNLRALCKAAEEVAGMPAVQDRLTRVSEIAAPISDTMEMLDGLAAMEGPDRLTYIKGVIKKYGLAKECAKALPVFDRSAAPPEGTPPPVPKKVVPDKGGDKKGGPDKGGPRKGGADRGTILHALVYPLSLARHRLRLAFASLQRNRALLRRTGPTIADSLRFQDYKRLRRKGVTRSALIPI